jgi:hypothetical protein
MSAVLYGGVVQTGSCMSLGLAWIAVKNRFGYRVSKPWGDSSACDVGVEPGAGVAVGAGEVDELPDEVWVFVRVQAESEEPF